MSIIIDFRLFFKENAGLSTDVDSTWVAFNSILINVLCWDLSLLVKKTRREWETMSTPDLVNLANQLSHIFDESHKRKNSKIQVMPIRQAWFMVMVEVVVTDRLAKASWGRSC